ncbi:MAG: hypothetical protein KAV87_51980 [Desulfobacteraceae bacterium]|nr:hypothetical protein [Desulfobacteraceae bacterium]
MLKFADVQHAFFFVGSSSYGMNSAVLCKNTGQIYYRSEMSGLDEISEEDLDWDTCVEIPHQNDLGLGQELVFEFVDNHLPDQYHQVRQFFRKRGAYDRFKSLLESKGLLQSWFDLENQREEQEFWQWCKDNEIDISG